MPCENITLIALFVTCWNRCLALCGRYCPYVIDGYSEWHAFTPKIAGKGTPHNDRARAMAAGELVQ